MRDKKIQEKNKIILKLKNKKKVQKLKEKGITLIALVVTIIILLILVGVTLNMALSGDGLFSRARNSAEKYKKAQEDEEKLISEIGKEMNSEYVGAYVTGYEPTGGECTIPKEKSGVAIGDDKDSKNKPIKSIDSEGNQTFTTEKEKNGKELKWRVWDYDGNTLRIILEMPTNQLLCLKGAEGYNYGVWVINEICRKCFGQYEENGITMKKGINVSNLKRSDIQKVSIYDYTKYTQEIGKYSENKDGKGDIKYGGKKGYENNYYPSVWKYRDQFWEYDGIKGDKEGLIWESEIIENFETNKELGNMEFKQNYYQHSYNKDEFINSIYYDLIFKGNGKDLNGEYFLAGRYVIFDKEKMHFGLDIGVGLNSIIQLAGNATYFSNDTSCISQYTLRPIVSIELDKSEYSLGELKIENGLKYLTLSEKKS